MGKSFACTVFVGDWLQFKISLCFSSLYKSVSKFNESSNPPSDETSILDQVWDRIAHRTWLLEIVAFQMLPGPPARIRVILLTPWCLPEDRLDDLLHPPGCFARIPNKPKPGKNTSVKRQATVTFSSYFYVAFFFLSNSRLPQKCSGIRLAFNRKAK